MGCGLVVVIRSDLMSMSTQLTLSFFFFNDTATTEIYTFPYTTLFRSIGNHRFISWRLVRGADSLVALRIQGARASLRSEEHTSELQSRSDIVCRLLLEKKKLSRKYA